MKINIAKLAVASSYTFIEDERIFLEGDNSKVQCIHTLGAGTGRLMTSYKVPALTLVVEHWDHLE